MLFQENFCHFKNQATANIFKNIIKPLPSEAELCEEQDGLKKIFVL